MKENEKNPVLGMAEQAMRNYEQAFQTGLKMQEEAWGRCSNVFNQTAYIQEAQKRLSDVASIVDKIMPVAQKSMEDMWEFMGKSAQTSADLMKKATDAAQAPAADDSQAKWAEFFKMSFRATRSNADAFMHLSSQTFDVWMDLFQKNIPTQMPRMEASSRAGAKG